MRELYDPVYFPPQIPGFDDYQQQYHHQLQQQQQYRQKLKPASSASSSSSKASNVLGRFLKLGKSKSDASGYAISGSSTTTRPSSSSHSGTSTHHPHVNPEDYEVDEFRLSPSVIARGPVEKMVHKANSRKDVSRSHSWIYGSVKLPSDLPFGYGDEFSFHHSPSGEGVGGGDGEMDSEQQRASHYLHTHAMQSMQIPRCQLDYYCTCDCGGSEDFELMMMSSSGRATMGGSVRGGGASKRGGRGNRGPCQACAREMAMKYALPSSKARKSAQSGSNGSESFVSSVRKLTWKSLKQVVKKRPSLDTLKKMPTSPILSPSSQIPPEYLAAPNVPMPYLSPPSASGMDGIHSPPNANPMANLNNGNHPPPSHYVNPRLAPAPSNGSHNGPTSPIQSPNHLIASSAQNRAVSPLTSPDEHHHPNQQLNYFFPEKKGFYASCNDIYVGGEPPPHVTASVRVRPKRTRQTWQFPSEFGPIPNYEEDQQLYHSEWDLRQVMSYDVWMNTTSNVKPRAGPGPSSGGSSNGSGPSKSPNKHHAATASADSIQQPHPSQYSQQQRHYHSSTNLHVPPPDYNQPETTTFRPQQRNSSSHSSSSSTDKVTSKSSSSNPNLNHGSVKMTNPTTNGRASIASLTNSHHSPSSTSSSSTSTTVRTKNSSNNNGTETLTISTFANNPSNPNKPSQKIGVNGGIMKRSSILATDVSAYQLLKQQTKKGGKAPNSVHHNLSSPSGQNAPQVTTTSQIPSKAAPELDDAFSESSDDLSDNAVTGSETAGQGANKGQPDGKKHRVRIAGQGIRMAGNNRAKNQPKTSPSQSSATIISPTSSSASSGSNRTSTFTSYQNQQSNRNQQRATTTANSNKQSMGLSIVKPNASNRSDSPDEDDVWSDCHAELEMMTLTSSTPKIAGLSIVDYSKNHGITSNKQHVLPSRDRGGEHNQNGGFSDKSHKTVGASSGVTMKVNGQSGSHSVQNYGSNATNSASTNRHKDADQLAPPGRTPFVTFDANKPQKFHTACPPVDNDMEFEEYEFDQHEPMRNVSQKERESSVKADIKSTSIKAENVVSLNVTRNPAANSNTNSNANGGGSSAAQSNHTSYIKHTKGQQSSSSAATGKFGALRRRKSRNGANNPGKLLQETIYEEDMEQIDDFNDGHGQNHGGDHHSVKIMVSQMTSSSGSASGGKSSSCVKPILKKERTYETPVITPNPSNGYGSNMSNICEKGRNSNNFANGGSMSSSLSSYESQQINSNANHYGSAGSAASYSTNDIYFDSSVSTVSTTSKKKVQFDQSQVVVCGGDSGPDSYDEENDDSDQWSNKSEDDEQVVDAQAEQENYYLRVAQIQVEVPTSSPSSLSSSSMQNQRKPEQSFDRNVYDSGNNSGYNEDRRSNDNHDDNNNGHHRHHAHQSVGTGLKDSQQNQLRPYMKNAGVNPPVSSAHLRNTQQPYQNGDEEHCQTDRTQNDEDRAKRARSSFEEEVARKAAAFAKSRQEAARNKEVAQNQHENGFTATGGVVDDVNNLRQVVYGGEHTPARRMETSSKEVNERNALSSLKSVAPPRNNGSANASKTSTNNKLKDSQGSATNSSSASISHKNNIIIKNTRSNGSNGRGVGGIQLGKNKMGASGPTERALHNDSSQMFQTSSGIGSRVLNPNSLLFHDTTRIRLNQSRPALHENTFKLNGPSSPQTKNGQGRTRLKQSNSFRSVSSVALRPREPPPPPPVASSGGISKSSFASVPARLQKALSTSTLLSKSTEKLHLATTSLSSSSKSINGHYGPGGRLLPSKSQISLPLGFTTTSNQATKAVGIMGSVDTLNLNGNCNKSISSHDNASNGLVSASNIKSKQKQANLSGGNNKTPQPSSSSSSSPSSRNVRAASHKTNGTTTSTRSKSLTDKCEALEKVLGSHKQKTLSKDDLCQKMKSNETSHFTPQNTTVTSPNSDIDSKNIEIVTKENSVSEIRIYSGTPALSIYSGGENLPYQGIIYEATKTVISTDNGKTAIQNTPKPPEIHYAATDLFPSKTTQGPSSPSVPFSHPPLPPAPKSPAPVRSPSPAEYGCTGKSVVLIIDNSKASPSKSQSSESALTYSQPVDTIANGNKITAVSSSTGGTTLGRALPQIPLPSLPQDYDESEEPLYDDVINNADPPALPSPPSSSFNTTFKSSPTPVTNGNATKLKGSLGKKSMTSLITSTVPVSSTKGKDSSHMKCPPPHQLGELPPLPPPPVPPHRIPMSQSSVGNSNTCTPSGCCTGQVVSSTLPCPACPPSLPPPNLPSKNLSEFHNRPLVIQENEDDGIINRYSATPEIILEERMTHHHHHLHRSQDEDLEEEVDNLYNDIGIPTSLLSPPHPPSNSSSSGQSVSGGAALLHQQGSSTLKSTSASSFASAMKEAFLGAIKSMDFDRRSVHSTGSSGSSVTGSNTNTTSSSSSSKQIYELEQPDELIYDDTLSIISSSKSSSGKSVTNSSGDGREGKYAPSSHSSFSINHSNGNGVSGSDNKTSRPHQNVPLPLPPSNKSASFQDKKYHSLGGTACLIIPLQKVEEGHNDEEDEDSNEPLYDDVLNISQLKKSSGDQIISTSVVATNGSNDYQSSNSSDSGTEDLPPPLPAQGPPPLPKMSGDLLTFPLMQTTMSSGSLNAVAAIITELNGSCGASANKSCAPNANKDLGRQSGGMSVINHEKQQEPGNCNKSSEEAMKAMMLMMKNQTRLSSSTPQSSPAPALSSTKNKEAIFSESDGNNAQSDEDVLDRTRTLLNELNEKLCKLNFPPEGIHSENTGQSNGGASSSQSSNSPGASSFSSTSTGDNTSPSSGAHHHHELSHLTPNDFSTYISKVVISPSSESSGVEEDYNSEKNYSLSNGSDAASSSDENYKLTAVTKLVSETISLARGKFLENMKLNMLSSGPTHGSPASDELSLGPGLLMMSSGNTNISSSGGNKEKSGQNSSGNGMKAVGSVGIPQTNNNSPDGDCEEEPIYEEIGENHHHHQSPTHAPLAVGGEHGGQDEDRDGHRSTSPLYADAFDAKSMFDGASRSEILSFLESIRDRLTGAESTSSSESKSSSISSKTEQKFHDIGRNDSGIGSESGSLVTSSGASSTAKCMLTPTSTLGTGGIGGDETNSVCSSTTNSPISDSPGPSPSPEMQIKTSPSLIRKLCPDCNDVQLVEEEGGDGDLVNSRVGAHPPLLVHHSLSSSSSSSSSPLREDEESLETGKCEENSNLNSGRSSSHFNSTTTPCSESGGGRANLSTNGSLCRSCNRKRNEKKEIIMEIYETELKYGRDLRIISEEFYKPIQIAGLLTKEQLDQIFLNVDQLIQISLELTSRLKAAILTCSPNKGIGDGELSQKHEDDLSDVNVGKIFLELGESMMTAFENYCTRQANAGALLSQLEKEKELLRIFLRVSQMENTVLRRMNLPAFLMVPVQRVTRYPLLLSRLLKVSPVDHFSRDELQSAQEKIEQHLEHMNKTTREVASVKLWRRISIINGNSSNSVPAHRRSNSDLDTSNIRIRKMAMDVMDWSNHNDVTCVIDNQLGSVHFNGKAMRNIYGCLLARGKDLDALASKMDQDLFFPPVEDTVKDVKLVLVRVKNTRFCLLREPLCLSKCVVSQGENEFQDFIEINEITTKNTYFIQGLDKQGTATWLKFLQCYSSCVGHWRRRRPALANIMMNGMIKHL